MLESLFKEVTGMKACNFIKKILQHMCFAVKFAKFLSSPVLKNFCKRLLLVFARITLINNILLLVKSERIEKLSLFDTEIENLKFHSALDFLGAFSASIVYI